MVSDKKEEIKKEPTLEPLLEWKSYAPAGFSLGEGNTFTLLGVLMSLLLAFKAKKELFQAQEKKDLVSLVKGRFVVVQQALKKGELREVGVQMVNASYLALGGVTGDGGAHQEIGKLLLKVPPSLRREVGEELEKLMDFFQIIGFAPEEMIEKFKDKKEL